MLEDMLISCNDIPSVSSDAADSYKNRIGKLVDVVNSRLENHPNIKELIGGNPVELMYNNHHNHALFIATVLKLNSYELLAKTVPWVYRACHARGFSYDYFPVELAAWQFAINQCIEHPGHRCGILAVYDWMVQQHETMIALSVTNEGLSFSTQSEANEMQQVLLSLLLHGDYIGCIRLADQSIHTANDINNFYIDVVWPAMYKIGQLWESNQISVAEEHLATAIVGRVMAALYPRFAQIETSRGKVVVTAGPNEFHEIGARMVADLLEIDGWDVTYLGANTPVHEILAILKRHKPFMVAISVATVFNLDSARQIIASIKEDQETRGVKVMVGGLAFNNMPELWQNFGADGYATGADGATRTANEWWQSRNV